MQWKLTKSIKINQSQPRSEGGDSLLTVTREVVVGEVDRDGRGRRTLSSDGHRPRIVERQASVWWGTLESLGKVTRVHDLLC